MRGAVPLHAGTLQLGSLRLRDPPAHACIRSSG